MRTAIVANSILPLLLLGGCAAIEFGPAPTTADNGFLYYEPVPYLAEKIAGDCGLSVEIISLPGRSRSVRYKGGLGTSKLNLTLSNGMVIGLNAERDTQIPQTITAVAGLAKTVADINIFAETGKPVPASSGCKPSLKVRRVLLADGTIALGPPLTTLDPSLLKAVHVPTADALMSAYDKGYAAGVVASIKAPGDVVTIDPPVGRTASDKPRSVPQP